LSSGSQLRNALARALSAPGVVGQRSGRLTYIAPKLGWLD
jgi:hypothetical protein